MVRFIFEDMQGRYRSNLTLSLDHVHYCSTLLEVNPTS
jgi:hypothetical protein